MKTRIALSLVLVIFAFSCFANCINGNCIDGKGKAKFPNGDQYIGDWYQGQMHGFGNYFFKSGAVYHGDFIAGKMHGKGQMKYPDGAKYIGAWVGNKKHGSGKLILPSGKLQDTYWANGKRVSQHSKPSRQELTDNNAAANAIKPMRNCNTIFCENGKGKYTYRDGTVYTGEFEEGKPSGEGQVNYANGDIYTGGWDESAPDGKGAYEYANGKRIAGIWSKGKLLRRIYQKDRIPEAKFTSTDQKPAPKASKRADGKPTMYAVVVGIGKYTAMQTLNYTDDDAYQMYAFLKSPEGGALADHQIDILVDEAATKNNIELALNDKLNQADADDIVMFYYSGHGVKGYFVPADFDGINNLLSHKRVEQLLANSSAKHKLVLADACHSGGLLAAKSAAAESSNRLYNAFYNAEPGTAVLLSSKNEEVSLESNGLRSGVFSHYLMKGMKGLADIDRNKIVTVSELYTYVYSRVREYTGNQQNPVLTGDFDRSMPVASLRF